MTVPQHMAALAKANDYRLRRSQLKREITAGDVRISEMLGKPDTPRWLESEPVGRLICAMRRVGPSRMRALLAGLEIPERKAIGKLTPRQRGELRMELAKLEARSTHGKEQGWQAQTEDTKDWLDGPALAAWLEENGLTNLELQLGNLGQHVSEWRGGGTAYVYTVDKVLTRMGLHLSQLPDDLWVEAPVRQEIVRRLSEGEPVKAVARTVGCAPSTVRYHRQREEQLAGSALA